MLFVTISKFFGYRMNYLRGVYCFKFISILKAIKINSTFDKCCQNLKFKSYKIFFMNFELKIISIFS